MCDYCFAFIFPTLFNEGLHWAYTIFIYGQQLVCCAWFALDEQRVRSTNRMGIYFIVLTTLQLKQLSN